MRADRYTMRLMAEEAARELDEARGLVGCTRYAPSDDTGMTCLSIGSSEPCDNCKARRKWDAEAPKGGDE